VKQGTFFFSSLKEKPILGNRQRTKKQPLHKNRGGGENFLSLERRTLAPEKVERGTGPRSHRNLLTFLQTRKKKRTSKREREGISFIIRKGGIPKEIEGGGKKDNTNDNSCTTRKRTSSLSYNKTTSKKE